MRCFKDLMVIGFVILSFLIVPNIYAADKGAVQGKEAVVSWEKHKGMDGKRQKLWDQLNLTDEQKKQLEENKAKNKESMKATFEKTKSFREALKAELMKPELDMAKINDIQSQVKSLQSQIVDNRLNSILDVRKILTHEQFEKFIDITSRVKPFQGKGDKDAYKER